MELVARLLGGLGLFLLGMRLMTDGLRLAAGPALQEILSRSTRTRLRGVASGVLVTSLVQSSSAVTVATIGFVNAGLLSLSQALAVTWGSNLGTTMTGWLVATIGFHVDVRIFALPLVGVGMGMRLFAQHGRTGSLGEALAGFGIFFLGIDVLRDGFAGLGDRIELASLLGHAPLEALLCVATGILLTVLMQSSSAALAVILTAAGAGVVPLGAGAALVIGANVGTTSTAALAAIGATPNARRVAAGHVVFNLLTAIVALMLLPLLLFAVVRSGEALALESEPAAVLAGFHTAFNLLGVALLWPLTNRLVRRLEGWFRSREEDEATPRYLDRNVVATPQLGASAIFLELTRAGQIARRISVAALSDDRRARQSVAVGERALARLVEAIGEYTQLLHRGELPPELDDVPSVALRVSRYYAEAAELAVMIASAREGPGLAKGGALDRAIRPFVARTIAFLESTGGGESGAPVEVVAASLADLEKAYHDLKSSLLEEGSSGRVPVHELVGALDWLSNVRRLGQQLERASRFQASLAREAGPPDRGADDRSR